MCENNTARAWAFTQNSTEVTTRGAEMLMKTDTLQDSLEKYRQKIGAGGRNRAAAYELALGSGRAYKPGDQISYYIKATPKKVAAYEAAKLASDFDPQKGSLNAGPKAQLLIRSSSRTQPVTFLDVQKRLRATGWRSAVLDRVQKGGGDPLRDGPQSPLR